MTNKLKLIIILTSICVVAIFAATLLVTKHNIDKEEKAKAEATAESNLKPLEETTVTKEKQYDYHVCVETGHGIDADGKWDTGATWNGYEEAKLMIPITQAMTEYLQERGVDVYTDAFSDNDRNLDETLDYLDTHNVDAFVNVHCDSEDAGSGTMPLYNTDEQKKLAECLNDAVHESLDIPDRGLQYRTDLETLCNPKVHCTSCLFETGSIRADNTFLQENAKAYGEALAKGLLNYLNQRDTAQ